MAIRMSGDLRFSSRLCNRMRIAALVGTVCVLSVTPRAVQGAVENLQAVGGAGVSEGDHILQGALLYFAGGPSEGGDNVVSVNPFRPLVMDGPDSTNWIFNVDITPGHNKVTISWETRFPGIDDALCFRVVNTSLWLLVESPLANTTVDVVRAVRVLIEDGIDSREVERSDVTDALAAAGIGLTDEFVDEVVELDRVLRTRKHSITVTGLEPDTQYEFEIKSVSLLGTPNPIEPRLFRTRAAPDLRSITGTDVDVQRTSTSVTATWITNRPANTRFEVNEVGMSPLPPVTHDQDVGSLTHAALFRGLKSNTRYDYTITSELVGVDDLINDGLLTVDQTIVVKTGSFKTRTDELPLRFVGQLRVIVSSNSAIVNVRLNQIARVVIDYGPVRGAIDDGASDATLYPHSVTSPEILNAHSITLSNLVPSTSYRIRVTATIGNIIVSTDRRGTEQWSRDIIVVTSNVGDDQPPEIIAGPTVDTRDVRAVVEFRTDVDTRATVFFGTKGGTYGTADEFRNSSYNQDGSLRLAQTHVVTIEALTAGTEYDFGILVEAINGRTTSFERTAFAGKATTALQPPGGGGSFTTTNFPDTQFPVIVSGPAISSKTHDTAIVEWTTDEPASAAVEFGVEGLDERETAGENRTTQKITLSNLTPGTRYQYFVASTDASGNGATESPQAVFTTNPEIDVTAPAIVGTPGISYKNERTATVKWTMNEETTAEVEFGPDAELGFIRSLPETDTVHDITLTNLEASTTYFYKVRSSDLSNNGPTESSILQFTTDGAPDLSSPVVSNIQVEVDEDSAILTWDTDELADSFVDFGTTSGLLTSTIGAVEDVTGHEITLTNLESATTYFYTVGSIDRANNAPTESSQASFTTLATPDLTPPAVPASLGAFPGSEQTVLNWDANDELDLAGYRVERRVAGVGSFVAIASGLGEPTYIDLSLTNLVAYEYRIVAVDRSNNASDPSTTISVTPTTTAAPTTPTELAHAGALRPTFRFTNAEPFAAGASLTYTVQVSTREDFANVVASESGITEDDNGVTSWTITRDLIEGDIYYWRVRALEGALIGPWTGPQEFAAEAVVLIADFNGDLRVNLDDFFDFIDVFGDAVSGDNAVFDLNNDGRIGLDDFFIFIDHFGESAVSGKALAFVHELDYDTKLWLEARGSAPMITGAENDRITVRVWADQVRDLQAFGLVVRYDPRIVRFDRAQPGAGSLLESQGGSAPLFRIMHKRKGQVLVGNGLTDGGAVSGHGLLAEFMFETVGAATVDQAYFELRQAFVKGPGAEGDVREVHQVISTQLVPQQFFLGANYPNPFNPSTQIRFALPATATVELMIYDVLGQHVRTLVAGEQHPAGYYGVSWDGTDEQHQAVSSGVYFYRMRTPDFQQTGRMTLVK